MRRYLKPNSLTWWCSVAPLLAGAFMAFEPVHGLTAWVASVDKVFEGASPGMLINAGLVGIGLRGAL